MTIKTDDFVCKRCGEYAVENERLLVKLLEEIQFNRLADEHRMDLCDEIDELKAKLAAALAGKTNKEPHGDQVGQPISDS